MTPTYEQLEYLGHTDQEIELLMEHDDNETLHAFSEDVNADGVKCSECGDTEEGLMHNNTWRNVEPLMEEYDPSPCCRAQVTDPGGECEPGCYNEAKYSRR